MHRIINMQYKVILFFIQIIIFCNEYNLINAKPLIGQNVRQANADQFNYVVCFLRKAALLLPSNIFCAGTLISNSIVLTAQHCLEDTAVDGFEIRAGSIDLRLSTRHLSIWWLAYGRWMEINNERPVYISNDIAVTKLLVPVSNAFIPAVLSRIPNRHFYETDALVAGWGRTNTGHMSMIMQTGNVTIMSNRLCANLATRLAESRQFITHGELCSIGNPYTLLELGDDGGPIISLNVIVGVNIGKFPHLYYFNPEVVNFHSSVYHYREFLDNILLDSYL